MVADGRLIAVLRQPNESTVGLFVIHRSAASNGRSPRTPLRILGARRFHRHWIGRRTTGVVVALRAFRADGLLLVAIDNGERGWHKPTGGAERNREPAVSPDSRTLRSLAAKWLGARIYLLPSPTCASGRTAAALLRRPLRVSLEPDGKTSSTTINPGLTFRSGIDCRSCGAAPPSPGFRPERSGRRYREPAGWRTPGGRGATSGGWMSQSAWRCCLAGAATSSSA